MTYPRRLRIAGQTVRVYGADNLHWNGPDGEGHQHQADGVYDEKDQTITLDNALGHERERETFLHETLHAVLSAAQMDVVINAAQEGLDEFLVSALSPLLIAFMRDNAGAIQYLQEDVS